MPLSSKRTLERPALGSVPIPQGRLSSEPKVVVRPVQPKLTEERMLQMERDAYEAGFAAGESAGYQVGEQAARSVLQSLTNIQTEMSAMRAQLLTDAEREMANLAMAVAAQVLGYEVNAGHPVVLAGIKAAQAHFAPSTRLTLRLHPDDRTLLEGHQAELVAILGDKFDLLSDATMTPGGAVVEGDGKLIDASLFTRFEQVVQQFLGEV